MLQDLKYAARRVLGNKMFSAVAVICLALGIGVGTTGFSVVDGVLIQPLPYRNADRLVVLNDANPQRGVRLGSIPYASLQDWQQQTSVFNTVAGFAVRSFTVADNKNDAERLMGGAVGWELFPMLGVQPIVGRNFSRDDDDPGAPPVALISYAIWQSRYAGNSSIVGDAIRVDGKPYTVIGVMPPGFQFPAIHHVWIPLGPQVHGAPGTEHNVIAFAQVKDGMAFTRVRDDLAVVDARLQAQFNDRGWIPVVRPMRDYFIPEDIELVLLTILGAVTLVLFVACANVANLLLARASTRRREIALRAALGASRARIVRQLLIESVMLALISTPFGLLFAYASTTFVLWAVPRDQVPSFVKWAIDSRSVIYAVSAAVFTGILFGLAPALQAVRVSLHGDLKDGSGGAGGGASRNRLLSSFVIAEIAVSFILLVGAALFVRTFMDLERVTGGLDPRPLMTMRLYLPAEGYESPDARVQRIADIVRRLEALPSVESAFASNLIPLGGGAYYGPVEIDGRRVAEGQEPTISYIGVTPHLLRTLHVPIRQGRTFTDDEAMSRSHVAVISEAMARRFWPHSSPIGQQFRILRDNDIKDPMTVIGVAADFRQEPVPGPEQLPSVYVPYPYNALLTTGLTIRARGDAAIVTNAARDVIRQSDPGIALGFVRSMDFLRQLGYWPYKIFSWVFAIMGTVALCLAAIGVYGVLAYSIAQRTQEFGVRVALGASRGDVLRLVLFQGLRLTGGGIIVGVVGALAVTHYIRTILYNVAAVDFFTIAAIVLGLLGVALLTSYLPARQATTVDPLVALRSE